MTHEQHRRGPPRRGDRGAGSLLAVALLGAVALVTAILVPLSSSLAVRSAVGGAADAAALAAADVAVGLAPGIPCEVAAHVAAANGATVVACSVDGLIVTVAASRGILGIDVVVMATAGPPG